MADDADAQAIAYARTRSRKNDCKEGTQKTRFCCTVVLINEYVCVDPVHPSHIPTDNQCRSYECELGASPPLPPPSPPLPLSLPCPYPWKFF